MIKVCDLLLKEKRGNHPLRSVEQMEIGEHGIVGNVSTLPSRQVLILPKEVHSKFSLKPGDLRENIVIEGFDIHELSSGTVVRIGEVKIRLTYHCEPCKRISEFASAKEIMHQRGYLGSFLNQGRISLGDDLRVLEKEFESIPYDIKERMQWYLDKVDKPVSIKKLAFEIGLSQSYYRAIPNMLKRMDQKYRDLVDYPSKK
ncbi:MOSC domain-containing protein [Aureibacter tunicatorum]|uniref:MOSC domain-containing protein YiiM n=1 Tax=Aureibacter tunicatorum TaxID=866807 RepID=A0AAE4BSP5_9BACT|nr:MOSC domain-containing protein [Aureibacter tunicatorum]MDR6239996.1 MOSC domain-containing protein YiiM [Aureibacter tunicatorum]BDD04468.1 hypothetical protein AUTU_19510 [Aureibacter tunicatorum]